jgi:hypothetical protein
LLAAVMMVAPLAEASTIQIDAAAFGPGATLTTFENPALDPEVNGLVVDGITFSYSGGNDQVIISDLAGETNNIAPQYVVSVGDNTGTLSLQFASSIDRFGFGYALLGAGTIANGVTISLFDGATLVGSETYTATPDPQFPGGFAGVESTLSFNRADLVFDSASSGAFALDNVRTQVAPVPVPVPEPATLLLLGSGLAGVAVRARRRRQG